MLTQRYANNLVRANVYGEKCLMQKVCDGYGKHDQLPYKKQKAIRSTKKDGVYDLMTDLGLTQFGC